jgi:Xaa-Pro aminopeptidase
VTEDVTPETSQGKHQELSNRNDNRSQRPDSEAFRSFITSGWGPRPDTVGTPGPAVAQTADRRARLAAQFPGERLVIPAGTYKTRSNDTDFRFRPHSAFAHLTGLGAEQEPDAVLVLHPVPDGGGSDGTHEAVLYMRPLAGRDTEEFFSDSRYGEFWVGARPTLEDLERLTGIRTAHLDDLSDALAKDAGPGGVGVVVVPGVDEVVEAVVEEIRAAEDAGMRDDTLAEALSELRLVKDAHEVEQMRTAVAVTVEGFEQIVRRLPEAVAHRRGERIIEATFIAHARQEGNAVGYETIAAAGEHATTLHWTDNDGQVRPGELVLIDAGAEVDSLYTADVTRTLPVDGTFTEVQRRVYQAVLDAADAAFTAATPGSLFRDVHAAAMEVIAARLAEWGLLPVSAEESLAPGASSTDAGWCTARATTSGSTCTTARRRAASSTSTRSSSRAWCSPSNPGCTSRATTCWCRRSTAASGCASRTTSSSRQTATRTCPPPCRVAPTRSRRGWHACSRRADLLRRPRWSRAGLQGQSATQSAPGVGGVDGPTGRAGQPDCTPPISCSNVRALFACSAPHSSAYDVATIWLVDVKSRLPPVNE